MTENNATTQGVSVSPELQELINRQKIINLRTPWDSLIAASHDKKKLVSTFFQMMQNSGVVSSVGYSGNNVNMYETIMGAPAAFAATAEKIVDLIELFVNQHCSPSIPRKMYAFDRDLGPIPDTAGQHNLTEDQVSVNAIDIEHARELGSWELAQRDAMKFRRGGHAE